jgi:hypothetical protein
MNTNTTAKKSRTISSVIGKISSSVSLPLRMCGVNINAYEFAKILGKTWFSSKRT